MELSEDFDSALAWTARRHAGQRRHNTATPYLSHLLATAAIVLEEDGGERLAIAALLHDVLEDTATGRDELRDRFGDEIYAVVDDCTDADRTGRASGDWAARKREHLSRMTGFADDSLLVIAADKVCSLQSLLDDLVRYGPALFDRSARSAAELLGNYQDVHAVLRPRLGHRAVLHRLGTLIGQLAAAVGSGRDR
jgi:(p)ppGpp synthase/HD superfamily hydrolase